jgi:methenyltetrahydrofolate cyclohydrolase
LGFDEMSLSTFADALGSDAATPGGGSASALAGALAASLVAMVARTTATTKSFADRAEEMNEITGEADLLRDKLLGLVDEDAKAFDRVMAAFRLPKETPEQQAARSVEIQNGYQAAVQPPMLVCRGSLRVLELALQIAERGKPNAVSDAGVAALLAGASLEGAGLNVEINLASIKDEAFHTSQSEALRELLAQGQALRAEALETVSAKLG